MDSTASLDKATSGDEVSTTEFWLFLLAKVWTKNRQGKFSHSERCGLVLRKFQEDKKQNSSGLGFSETVVIATNQRMI
jgi:hypothetical protein